HCIDRCEFEAVQANEIKRKVDCDCQNYIAADSVNVKIYTAIKNYFDGLSSLTNVDISTYSLDALNEPLLAGNFGNVEIKPEQAAAYSNISNLLYRAATDGYRKKKIKNYIEQANAPLKILLDKFKFIIQENLSKELDFKKERLYAFYTELKLNDRLSEYEKIEAWNSYYKQLNEINDQQEQLAVFAESLTEIAAAHEELYKNRNKLSATILQQELGKYGNDIQDLYAQFKQLNQ
ncbi:MAG: hypothetical protein V7767_15155, partial [Leeuwenhoekiella sp.]